MTANAAANAAQVELEEEVPDEVQAEAEINPEDVRLIEALIFATPDPLDEGAIAGHLSAGTDVRAVLAAVAERHHGSGIELVRLAGKWAFRTAADLAPRLRIEREVRRRLSRAAVETLAIVAYHQPVTRAEIEDIRGVAVSRGTLDGLLEYGWIKPGRRRETPGRPGTWLTTEQFLVHFGLTGLSDLPGVKELKAAGLLDTRPAMAVYGAPGDRDTLLENDTGDADEMPEPLAEDDSPDAAAAEAGTDDDGPDLD